MQYIDAVIDNKSVNTDNFYTYKAPDEVSAGAKLTVPFSRRSKSVDAYCVRVGVESDLDESKIKEIDTFDPDRSLSSEMVGTAMWMRKRYGVKYIDGLKMFAVEGKREKALKTEISGPIDPDFELTDEQRSAADRICASVEMRETKTYLIKGVTNSGKTEVYMQAVAKALELGRTAIVLLPEIALSAQVADRFRERFGADKVATIHSRLKKSERLSEWLRVRNGEARIVVGARTSVFAPLDNIGIIVIDEEHESTYKSDHNPKYETVDIAYKRASLSGAVLVLGSATPSVTSYYRAKNGDYELFTLKERIGDAKLPAVHCVDMRQELKDGNRSMFSDRLKELIEDRLDKNEQIMLFITVLFLCGICIHAKSNGIGKHLLNRILNLFCPGPHLFYRG